MLRELAYGQFRTAGDEETARLAIGESLAIAFIVRADWLAQRLERCPELLAEDLRLFPGGEVAAPAGLVEVDEVGVNLLGPALRRLDDLAREDGEADRERQL